ncbi:hypothetical protein HID58_086662 [Brassica napus]|uniref:Uncharacterized protein n=1 Tax=Brassica napus TaxID=3708 RepID=A0ABQ7XTP6_BRANA|nr:hypothetical protein HID58_086662 [Brassica napus]
MTHACFGRQFKDQSAYFGENAIDVSITTRGTRLLRDCWGLNLEQRLWWKGKLRKYNPWQQSTCLNKRKKAPPVRRRLDVIGNMKYAGEAGIFKMEVSLLTRVLVATSWSLCFNVSTMMSSLILINPYRSFYFAVDHMDLFSGLNCTTPLKFLVPNMSSEMKEERREEDNGKACGDEYRGKSSTEVVRTVTEEEVDEFFKILRRLHVATRTVARVNGGDAERELPSKKRKRIQSLGLRSSLDTNEVQDGESDGINRVGLRNLGLDLNCQPETEAVKIVERESRLGPASGRRVSVRAVAGAPRATFRSHPWRICFWSKGAVVWRFGTVKLVVLPVDVSCPGGGGSYSSVTASPCLREVEVSSAPSSSVLSPGVFQFVGSVLDPACCSCVVLGSWFQVVHDLDWIDEALRSEDKSLKRRVGFDGGSQWCSSGDGQVEAEETRVILTVLIFTRVQPP